MHALFFVREEQPLYISIARIGVASEVAVGFPFVKNCKADPAEILLTGNAGHLVAAHVFLKKKKEKNQ